MAEPVMTPLRAVLADDALELRGLLVKALEKDGRITVVGVAGDGEEAVAAVREHRPDVLVLDVSMPKLDGIGVLRRLVGDEPAPVVVILTGYAAGDLAERCTQAGAAAYIEKGTPLAQVRDRIVEAARAR